MPRRTHGTHGRFLARQGAIRIGVLAAAAAVLVGGQPTTANGTPTGERVVARYSFDQQLVGGGAVDESGLGHTLRPIAADGGRLALVPHDSGRAVQFPPRCDTVPCPRAVLSTDSTAALNPYAAPLRYGASIRLTGPQASTQTLLHKGARGGGARYELRLEGTAATPHCVIAGPQGRAAHAVADGVSIADGRWHRLQCHRASTSLQVIVDDLVRGTAPLPAHLSIVNRAPLTVGATGAGQHNRQFHGVLDFVWISIG